MVEQITLCSRTERNDFLKEAGFNPFLLPSHAVFIDLLTDSGTSAMSDNQWAGLLSGDEAYAGSKNFFNLKETIKEIMGFEFVLPTHQGRAAENILFTVLVREGSIIPSNMHFDTTKAHVLHKKGIPVNLIINTNPSEMVPFKGNMDINKLDRLLAAKSEAVPLVMLTITCNSNGGQPVSMDNIRQVRQVCDKYNIPLFLDACRFAENAYFIKQREPGYRGKSVSEIVKEMFSYAHGCTMSAKKDALVNIGGFLAVSDEALYRQCLVWAVLFEGFPTYGGLAGRDLEAMARGLKEVLNEHYLSNRIRQVQYLADQLICAGIPIVLPAGGHAVYLDASTFLPHIPQNQFPGWALTVNLYLEAGIRAVEIGTVMSGRDPETGEHDYPPVELVRLAIPRRVYTDRHMDYVARSIIDLWNKRKEIRGMRIISEPPVLRHFTATFDFVDNSDKN